MQGDVRFAEVMKLMGATVEYEPNAIVITGPQGKLKGFDHNCNDIPDAAMTAAVAAIFAEGCELFHAPTSVPLKGAGCACRFAHLLQ